MQKSKNQKKMDDTADIDQDTKDALTADLLALTEWVEEFGIDRLKSLCSTIAEVARSQPERVNSECTRILDAVLPQKAARLMRQLLQRCTPKLLRLVKELAPTELSSGLLEIIVSQSPWIVGKAPAPGQSHLWQKLEPTLAIDMDGDCLLNLRFHREDGQTFFIQGPLDTAIGRVLPMIMETLARAEKMELSDEEIKHFNQAHDKLDQQIRKVQAGAKPRGTSALKKDVRSMK